MLHQELGVLGGNNVRETIGGVSFSGTPSVAYRACLWSRLASRILLPLSKFEVGDTDALYAGAREIDWTNIFAVTSTFVVEVAGRSANVPHSQFAALRVKDAVADRFRDAGGERPSVDRAAPDIRIHLHLHREQATVSLDLAGESLHRRGWRKEGVDAPLKENLAAALLVRAKWPDCMEAGGAFLDPMCGSGTLPIEAALIASDSAPGLTRERFGFEAWLDHRPAAWRELREEAESRAEAGLSRTLPPIVGRDIDLRSLKIATANARRAGVARAILFEAGDLSEARPPAASGLLMVNPPYGERIGAEAEVIKLHSLLGSTLKQYFAGWRAAVFTSRSDLGHRIGLRAQRKHALYNGPIACELLQFEVFDAPAGPPKKSAFGNRLRKNWRHLTKWARRADVAHFRVYDTDLKEYAVAVDVYEARERHVFVQEFQAPSTVDAVRAEKRLRESLAIIQDVLEVPADRLHFRLRKPQRGKTQYGKLDERGRRETISEHGCRLLVNFEDYLDTGLFLDHRPLRRRIQAEANGKRFLNLFCYTGSASAHATIGGASQTTSVDLSRTYLEWAQRNLALNGRKAELLARAPPPGTRLPAHALLRADAVTWLQTMADAPRGERYDLILLDPPTFSNSKRMEEVLDVQRDQVTMIRNSAALLAPGGTLYFSTNRRGFKLDEAALEGLRIEDITRQTLDEDFRRPRPPHRCWRISIG